MNLRNKAKYSSKPSTPSHDNIPESSFRLVNSEHTASVRGVSWSEVATVPKRKSHRGLDLDLSLNSEKNIWKGWKKNGGTK